MTPNATGSRRRNSSRRWPYPTTPAKQQGIARELDTRVHYLRLTGLAGIALFAAMAGRIDDFSKRPGDTSDTRAWGVSRADFEYLRQQGIPNAF